ncbi:MAG: ABC transporter ATP-binding protein [Pseudomonadota bacterium]
MADPELSLTEIAFAYGSLPVLSDVTHRFAPGRLTVICGPNGSGKSTLFRVASGQDRPRSGAARLGRTDIARLPAKTRARAMAMLPQSPDAPAELLVRDLVALGRYAYRRPLAGLAPQDRAAIDAALAATDIATLADRPLAELSGGQKQRAWIAMTLAQQAPILLLDEPTNHLDISHAVETMHLLRHLVEREGKTVIAVLHDINLMTSFADEVVLMKAGRIVAAGPFAATVSEARLSALYDRPCRFGAIEGSDRPFVQVR